LRLQRLYEHVRTHNWLAVYTEGHLFLALMPDGGIYEFEPMKKGKPQ
jgi:hypothetical protein